MVDTHPNLFEDEYAVTGAGRRRVVDRLSQIWAHLTLSFADGRHPRRVTVIDQLNCDATRLEVQQPIHDGEHLPRLQADQPIRIARNDQGLRIGSEGRVESVAARTDFIGYVVQLEGRLFRRERRDAFRVAIGPADGLEAQLILGSLDEPLPCDIGDLSMSGCRLMLTFQDPPPDQIESAFAEYCGVQLTFSEDDRQMSVHNAAEAVWISHGEADALQAGLVWQKPEPAFIREVRRFVMRKERELLKRRSQR